MRFGFVFIVLGHTDNGQSSVLCNHCCWICLFVVVLGHAVSGQGSNYVIIVVGYVSVNSY